VQKSATKEIQGMQAVSNLPISALLTAAARRGFSAVQVARGSQALIDTFETACIPSILLVPDFCSDHIEKAVIVT